MDEFDEQLINPEHLHIQRLQQQILELKKHLAIAQEHNIIIENSLIWRSLRRVRRLKTSYKYRFLYKYKQFLITIESLFKRPSPIILPRVYDKHDLSKLGKKIYDTLCQTRKPPS